MGAVSVANGEPQAALPYFTRAQQLGAPLARFGCDRGLAYDLLGQQAHAQADYRAALEWRRWRRSAPPPGAEPGDQRRPGGRLETLAPLMAQAAIQRRPRAAPSSLR